MDMSHLDLQKVLLFLIFTYEINFFLNENNLNIQNHLKKEITTNHVKI
jgi:hypothetical protein